MRAHVDRLILEAFAAAVDRCEDADLVALLGRVCDLYALATIENDGAWFQEHGRISSTRAKLVTRAVNRLCAELREHAELLVDGFGIPDAVLRAPIGLKNPVSRASGPSPTAAPRGGLSSRTSSRDNGGRQR